MMMPANFSAVNAEVVYGGAVADYLPNAWTAANVKQFNTNLVTLVSNTFTQALVSSTLGVMFSGNWGGDNGFTIFGSDGALTHLFKHGILNNPEESNFFNKVMTGLGLAASVYTLGTNSAAVLSVKKVTNSNGQVWGSLGQDANGNDLGDGWIG